MALAIFTVLLFASVAHAQIPKSAWGYDIPRIVGNGTESMVDGMVGMTGRAERPLQQAIAAIAADTFPQADDLPEPTSKLDVGLGLVSISAASIAASLTAVCVSDGTCREVVPLMKRWIDDSLVKALIFKAAIGAGIHYVVYRFAPKGRIRTGALAILAGVNLADAIHDVRVTQQIRNRDR